MQLSEIFIYPVKSLRGISLQSAKVEARGLAYDRRWMLVDEAGHFFTQRKFPEMALLTTALTEEHLVIEHATKSLGKLLIPHKAPENQPSINVKIWDDTCQAILVSKETDQWLSEVLNTNCHLVYMPDTTQRFTDPTYSQPDDIVSFADGYPFLMIGQASLDDLNERLEEKITINRFRPNFVFTGGTPFEEDSWRQFSIGDLNFRAVKPCARCEIPSINPETGIFGKEPTRTLSKYRLHGHKILFGMNVCWDVNNEYEPIIKIGDSIEISE